MNSSKFGSLPLNVLLSCAALAAMSGCSHSASQTTTQSPDPAAIRTYSAILKTWSDGSQAGAESLLTTAVTQYPNDQPLGLFQAACVRSRFDIQLAAPLFWHVSYLARDTPQGRCAATMNQMDRRQDIERGFATLRTLVQANPTDPIPLWLLAIQCRSYKRNQEGAECYRKLLALIGTGPSLVHQTYANILDELDRHQEALVHRELAVKLEPATWSYDGWADTLEDLDQDQKAYEIRKQAAVLFGRPMPTPPEPQAIDIPQPTRRRIYDEAQRLLDRLMKERPSHDVDLQRDPALQDFRQKHQLTFEEYMDIDSEGAYWRWDLDTEANAPARAGKRKAR